MKTLNRQKVFPINFQNFLEDAMLPATGFARVPQIANQCQIPCCIIKFCYSWVNKCDVTRLRHKYQWHVEVLVTSSITPYLNILYPYRYTGPPTTPGPQTPHHLNPALWRPRGTLKPGRETALQVYFLHAWFWPTQARSHGGQSPNFLCPEKVFFRDMIKTKILCP